MTGRLSGWAMPSSLYVPKFEIELAKYIIENGLELNEDILNEDFLGDFSAEAMGVRADFRALDENTNNYYLLVLESVYY